MPTERRADLWFALLLTALSLVVLVEAWRMPRLADQGVHPMSVPGLTPGLIALVLLVLGVMLLWRSLRERGSTRVAAVTAEAPAGASTWPRALLALLLCLAYAPGLLGRLPFLLSTGLFVFGFIAVFSFERERALRTLGGALLRAVAVSVSVSLLFEQLFLVRLP
jgi:putative tricarboxylic transport membrane protein